MVTVTRNAVSVAFLRKHNTATVNGYQHYECELFTFISVNYDAFFRLGVASAAS